MWDFIADEAVRGQVEEKHGQIVKTMEATLQEKVDAAVSGLKTKNDELLGEVKESKKVLKDYQSLGELEKVRESLQWLKDNEDAQLIKDGRIDEVVHRRTQEMREKHEETVNEYAKKVDELAKEGATYKQRYETKMVEDELTKEALKSGVLPGAIPDVLRQGVGIFNLGQNGEVEARDKDGKLMKTKEGDLILTPSNWINALKITSAHYWPQSTGAGNRGGGAGDPGDMQARIDEAARTGNHKLYRELREKQAKGMK